MPNEDRVAVKPKDQTPPPGGKGYWEIGLENARSAFKSGDQNALISARDQLKSLINHPKQPHSGRLPPLVSLYNEMLHWKLTGEFNTPFDQLNVAQIQTWELENKCPDDVYFRLFIEHAVERFKNARGFQMFKRIFDTVKVEPNQVFLQDEKSQDIQVHRREGAKITIIGFSGVNHAFSGIGWNTFDRIVAGPIEANLIVIKDLNLKLYLSGIKSVGNYDKSCAKIYEILQDFKDTKIIAIGGSAGVFGALSIASDLGLTHVVALAGPTSIEIGEASPSRQVYQNIAEDVKNGVYPRPNLVERINNSAIKRIDFFVAGQNKFDCDQMNNISKQCQGVVPHIYQDLKDHIVTDFTIEDGSLYDALCAEFS